MATTTTPDYLARYADWAPAELRAERDRLASKALATIGIGINARARIDAINTLLGVVI